MRHGHHVTCALIGMGRKLDIGQNDRGCMYSVVLGRVLMPFVFSLPHRAWVKRKAI